MQEKKNQKDLKELAVFEMLEDAANDSSFCSTSSRVKTLMNHSILPSPQVPLALYPIRIFGVQVSWYGYGYGYGHLVGLPRGELLFCKECFIHV